MDWPAIGFLLAAATAVFVMVWLQQGRPREGNEDAGDEDGPQQTEDEKRPKMGPVSETAGPYSSASRTGSEMRTFVKCGALWLQIVGVLLLLGGAGCTLMGAGWMVAPHSDETHFFFDIGGGLFAVGLIGLAIGAGHVTAGIGMWYQRTWGRGLGAALGAGGLILTAWVWLHEPGSWVLVVPALAYGLTFAAALIWYPDPPVGPRSH